jgi:hypothetical protein
MVLPGRNIVGQPLHGLVEVHQPGRHVVLPRLDDVLIRDLRRTKEHVEVTDGVAELLQPGHAVEHEDPPGLLAFEVSGDGDIDLVGRRLGSGDLTADLDHPQYAQVEVPVVLHGPELVVAHGKGVSELGLLSPPRRVVKAVCPLVLLVLFPLVRGYEPVVGFGRGHGLPRRLVLRPLHSRLFLLGPLLRPSLLYPLPLGSFNPEQLQGLLGGGGAFLLGLRGGYLLPHRLDGLIDLRQVQFQTLNRLA